MIVNDGLSELLNAQLTYLAGLEWGLFTSNTTITSTTVFGSLTEAAWAGYARATVGAMGAVVVISAKSITVPSTSAAFVNTSGAAQPFFGWFLHNPATGKLVAAVNIGSTNIANGATYPLAAAVTDTEA